MSTADDKEENSLREKLEELESLLDSSETEPGPRKIAVPVLDELVTEADFIKHEDEHNVEQIEEQIVELAGKLEHKFAGELDQLVRLLKDNLRNSIVEELRSQANLDREVENPAAASAENDDDDGDDNLKSSS